MKAVIQRVSNASVTIDGDEAGRCGKGMLILLGVMQGDTEQEAGLLAEKIAKLRIFSDSDDRMNLSAADIGGEALVIPNFTLAANCSRGNRPDFFGAAKPDTADKLYNLFVNKLSERLTHVGCGVFGADMSVSLVNDGPVTIILDSAELCSGKGAPR